MIELNLVDFCKKIGHTNTGSKQNIQCIHTTNSRQNGKKYSDEIHTNGYLPPTQTSIHENSEVSLEEKE